MVQKMHYNIRVIGKVQGVWFRKYTKEKADELGIEGFVKNQSNGEVYVEAEGTQEQVMDLVTWLYTGSPNSEVSDVMYKESAIRDFKAFVISS